MTKMHRQSLLFPELATSSNQIRNERRSRFSVCTTSGERVPGWLRREARDFFPECGMPITDPQRAIAMLYAMCDYLDEAMADPLSVQRLAVGGSNVWVLGLVGFRISAELNIIAMLENHGEKSEELDADFNLARPLETIKPYQMMVDCLYPVLLPEGSTRPYPPLNDGLRDWLAHCAETLLLRDPAFRHLIRQTLPMALRLPEPVEKLCLSTRARPKGLELHSCHARTVITHQDALTRVARENPKLMQLLIAFIDSENGQLDPDDPIHQLKRAVLKAGHSEAAWRYLCRYGSKLFKVVCQLTVQQPTFEVAMRYLAAMEAAGLPPPPPRSVAIAWLKAFNVNHPMEGGIELSEGFHQCMEPRILGVALNEAHRLRHSPRLQKFIPEFLGVCWWSQQANAKLDKNQVHAGWPWFVNQWRSEQSLQEVLAAAKRITWPMQLGVVSIGPWQVVPLNSSEALVRESFAMRNCLSDYVVRCAAGVDEYYSVRDRVTGKRNACLGFRFDDLGIGSLLDVKGFANSKPLPVFGGIADQLQSLVNMTSKSMRNSVLGDG